jgi:hypothetical protein
LNSAAALNFDLFLSDLATPPSGWLATQWGLELTQFLPIPRKYKKVALVNCFAGERFRPESIAVQLLISAISPTGCVIFDNKGR